MTTIGAGRAAILLALLLPACAAPPPEPAPPPVAAASTALQAPPGPPRSCAAIEAELGDTSEINAAVAGVQRNAEMQMAAGIGTSVLSTVAGMVPVPGVGLASGLVSQGIQAAQGAAMSAQNAAVQSSVARVMARHRRLMAEYEAAGCTGGRPLAMPEPLDEED
jgi:hypothetical protein